MIKLLPFIFLYFLHCIRLTSCDPIEKNEIQLFYASSFNKTINGIHVIIRQFYILTESLLTDEISNVLIHHEVKNDLNWVNVPANLIFSKQTDVNTTVSLWKAEIKWMSLGSEYKYEDSFAIACKRNNISVWDNNKLHNYRLENDDGFFLGNDWNIKAHEIEGSCDVVNRIIKLKGNILIRNINFRKSIKVYYSIDDEFEDPKPASYSVSPNNLGIEQWMFQFELEGIKKCPDEVPMYFVYEVAGEKYIDNNLEDNYHIKLTITNNLL